MKADVLRQLTYHFNQIYFKPEKPGVNRGSSVTDWPICIAPAREEQHSPNRKLGRCCGLGTVIVSFLFCYLHARRKLRQRYYQDEHEALKNSCGIGVYTPA